MKTRANTVRLNQIPVNHCYLCQSKKRSQPILTVHHANYVRCLHCNHVYCTTRMSRRAENDFYAHDQLYSQTYADPSQIKYRFQAIAKPKVKFVFQHIKDSGQGNWLDIGCGVGDVIAAVEKRTGWHGVGLDISSKSIEAGRKYFQVELLNQQLLAYHQQHPKKKFEVISFFGYLGITSQPMKELQAAIQMLKPTGYLVISESNADSFSTLLQRSYPDFSTRHLLPSNTVQMFTHQSLAYTLDKLKLKPLAEWIFGLDFTEFLKYLSLLEPSFQKKPIFEYILGHVNDFQTIIDRDQMGDCLLVISQRKS